VLKLIKSRRLALLLLSALFCAASLALVARAQLSDKWAQNKTPAGEIHLTIAHQSYVFPEAYVSTYTPARAGERPGALLRVALPSFSPWRTLDAPERKRTPWAGILISEGASSGYLERILQAYTTDPAYSSTPRPYNPRAAPDLTEPYDVFTGTLDGHLDYVLGCRRRVCVLHYVLGEAYIYLTHPNTYFDQLPTIRFNTDRLLKSFQQ
jgi:hypothetical protein